MRRHELLLVLEVAVAAPVELEQARVQLQLVAVRALHLRVLDHSAHHLRQEGRVVVVEEVHAQAQVLGQAAELLRGQLLVLLVGADRVAVLVGDQKLGCEGFTGLLLRGVDELVECLVGLLEGGGRQLDARLVLVLLADEPALHEGDAVVVGVGGGHELLEGGHVVLVELLVEVVLVPAHRDHRLQVLEVLLLELPRRSPRDLLQFVQHKSDLLVARLHDLEVLGEAPLGLELVAEELRLHLVHDLLVEEVRQLHHEVVQREGAVGVPLQADVVDRVERVQRLSIDVANGELGGGLGEHGVSQVE